MVLGAVFFGSQPANVCGDVDEHATGAVLSRDGFADPDCVPGVQREESQLQ